MFNFFFDEKNDEKLHVTKYMYGAYVKKDTFFFVFLKEKKDMISHKQKNITLFCS